MSGIIEELNGRNREIVEKYETVKIYGLTRNVVHLKQQGTTYLT